VTKKSTGFVFRPEAGTFFSRATFLSRVRQPWEKVSGLFSLDLFSQGKALIRRTRKEKVPGIFPARRKRENKPGTFFEPARLSVPT
jgi:hypothetical protein